MEKTSSPFNHHLTLQRIQKSPAFAKNAGLDNAAKNEKQLLLQATIFLHNATGSHVTTNEGQP